MKRLDTTFGRIEKELGLSEVNEVENINFDCLRKTVDSYEMKCGKLSDYGLKYVKTLAKAC